jgi:hypothetical protein
MKRILFIIILAFFIIDSGFSQEKEKSGMRIFFHGIVMDANTLQPISNSQILINRDFTSVSSIDGTFSFFVNRNDTVLFKHLGYKPTQLFVSDTLAGKDFVAGVFMKSDTLSIGEVVIVPRVINFRSHILNSPSKVPQTMDNARYNVANAAYQGRTTQGKLGDPQTNYQSIQYRQKMQAFEKGGIPSDKIVGISPLLILPAAYLLIHGLPQPPAPMEQKLSDQEIEQVQKLYLESLRQQK